MDMTEEEVQMALSKVDASGEVSGPDWPQGGKPNDPRSQDSPHQAQVSPQDGSLLLARWQAFGKGAQASHSGPEQL